MNYTLTEIIGITIVLALMCYGVYWIYSAHTACEDLGGVLYKGVCVRVDIIKEYDR